MNQEKIGPRATICENLPLDLTFYARDGLCQISEENCPFVLCPDLPVCRKKTAIVKPLSSTA